MENLIELIHLPFFNEQECLEIIQYIEEKENYLKQNLKDEFDKKYRKNDDTSTYTNYTTGMYSSYNFFKDNPKYISRLKRILKNNYHKLNYPLVVQSWVNFYKKNQDIKWHKHSRYSSHYSKGLTANIFVGGDENLGVTYAFPYINYPKYNYHNVKNKLGQIQIVDSSIYHMVKPNNSDQKRYTIGMTITEFDMKFSKHFIYDSLHSKDIIILFDDDSSYEDNRYVEEKQKLFNYS